MEVNVAGLEMYAIEPKQDCPHIPELEFDKLHSDLINLPCVNCDNVNENWLCLCCYTVRCSRYVKSHMLEFHTQNPEKHLVCLSFSDLSFWCQKCDSQIASKDLSLAYDVFHNIKFGNQSLKFDSKKSSGSDVDDMKEI